LQIGATRPFSSNYADGKDGRGDLGQIRAIHLARHPRQVRRNASPGSAISIATFQDEIYEKFIYFVWLRITNNAMRYYFAQIWFGETNFAAPAPNLHKIWAIWGWENAVCAGVYG
jgi:hypothetical protein